MLTIRLQSRVFWLLALVCHALAAGAWWWFMPHGFAPDDPHFWTNQILPPVAILCIIIVVIAAHRGRLELARTILALIACMWLVAAVSARIVFPVSFANRWLIFLALAAVVGLAAFAALLRPVLMPRALFMAAMLAGITLGAWLPLTQRGEAPSTHPLNSSPPADPPAEDQWQRSIGLRGVDVSPSTGMLKFQHGRYISYVQPMLTFISRSPDRCWTVFASPEDRTSAARTLRGYRRLNDGVELAYADEGLSWLTVEQGADSTVTLESISQLSRPVYSHLNTFCEIEFAGHRRAYLTFSPCPDERIEVTHSEYPFGKPARFAYLGNDGQFRIVQATSGEKGPFTTLAQGVMSRKDPLVITLFDENRPAARYTLNDWAAQASTAPSPTAGWRVPANAIEFGRDTDKADSTVSMFVTLAATSIGRGFDSVGHAAGIYRNRMRVELLDEATGPAAGH